MGSWKTLRGHMAWCSSPTTCCHIAAPTWLPSSMLAGTRGQRNKKRPCLGGCQSAAGVPNEDSPFPSLYHPHQAPCLGSPWAEPMMSELMKERISGERECIQGVEKSLGALVASEGAGVGCTCGMRYSACTTLVISTVSCILSWQFAMCLSQLLLVLLQMYLHTYFPFKTWMVSYTSFQKLLSDLTIYHKFVLYFSWPWLCCSKLNQCYTIYLFPY